MSEISDLASAVGSLDETIQTRNALQQSVIADAKDAVDKANAVVAGAAEQAEISAAARASAEQSATVATEQAGVSTSAAAAAAGSSSAASAAAQTATDKAAAASSSASEASSAASEATAAKNLAIDWAVATPGEEVEGGEFSAKHYAQAAAEIASKITGHFPLLAAQTVRNSTEIMKILNEGQ